MKQSKERVLALDYFRGICILMVIINHAGIFSYPFNYLTGAGGLWTSAAEMFFLISGITLSVVRGPLIATDFKAVIKKSWRRARDIYLVYILSVFAALGLASLVVGAGLFNYIPGTPPTAEGFSLIWRTLALAYTPGWANFLMYYAIFMLIAPFALKALHKKYWPVAPLASLALLVACAPYPLHLINLGDYATFGLWQAYFFIGLTLGRFRRPIIGWIYGLPGKLSNHLQAATVSLAIIVLGLSALIDFKSYAVITRLTSDGWLPEKLQAAYIHLINHSQTISLWFMNGRWGLLRPLASLLFLGAAYLIYQRYKQTLLARTGRFVNTMGRDTLWIFVAQALVIPLLAAIPIKRDVVSGSLLTALLIASMWLVTQRRTALAFVKSNQRKLSRSLRLAMAEIRLAASGRQAED